MITATLKVTVSPQHRSAALRTLRSVQGPTRAKPGCVGCHILYDDQEPTVLIYTEGWGSREQLERHLRSTQYRRLLAVAEMSEEPPEIQYDTVSRREGIELLEAERAEGSPR